MRMPLLVYITCKDRAEAVAIAEALLDKRLVACANIAASPVLSLYLWQGRRERAEETLLLVKTMEDRFTELNALVRALHSYDTPCVAALPLVAGDADFLAWIEASTRPQTLA